MRTSDLQYELPAECIAQHPAARRDASRLLVLDKRIGAVRHEKFASLAELLPEGSLLVLNDTAVLAARLSLRRATGGRVDGLFLQEVEPGCWEVMLTGSARLKPGEELAVDGDERGLVLIERKDAGHWYVRPAGDEPSHDFLEAVGKTPLPPYIGRSKRASEAEHADDRRRYQTVYASRPGAVAAPTAGLHFTAALFDRLKARGIATARVTLHVGVGTFAPIRADDLADHRMHAEWYDCPAVTAEAVASARAAGRPVIAVGTTSVRVLETVADERGALRAGQGWTEAFIYPPYTFKVVDGLVTNFHLPGSTLLAMVFALAGRERVLAAYNEAIEHGYRFYSYGDAMFIMP